MTMDNTSSVVGVMDPEGPTGKLCNWIESVTLEDIPSDIKTRAKYLILDGIGCGLTGAHLPWSETAVKGVADMEGEGTSPVWGWERSLGPLPAALLNSTFVQAFELDDWHDAAPLHSNSILLPALFAAASHLASKPPNPSQETTSISGSQLLLATLVGYETGPRVGLALHGANMLSTGWHSGSVFGPPTAAAAVSKLLSLPANEIEDALGIACTQAGGLMAAQYESMVKRMQHGFAARNGLFGALMARSGYVGIKKVFERPYGGYLSCFGRGSGKEPPFLPDQVCKDLGEKWQTNGIRVKKYAAMAATHATIECIAALQAEDSLKMKDAGSIRSVFIELGEAAFKHGGFAISRPITSIGAQMSNIYVAACQLLDRQVLPPQFSKSELKREEIWELVEKTSCVRNDELGNTYATRVTITFEGDKKLVKRLEAPKSVAVGLSNEEIVEKWRSLSESVIDVERAKKIEEMVLNLDRLDSAARLADLLKGETSSPIAG